MTALKLTGAVLLLSAVLGCEAETSPKPSVPALADEARPSARAPEQAASGAEPAAVVSKLSEGRLLASTLYHFQCLIQLQEPSVRRTLQLSDEQAAELAEVSEEAQERGDALRRVSRDDLQRRLDEEYTPVAERYRGILETKLTGPQRENLWKIVVQQQPGAIALLLPQVPERLEMTGDQVQWVENIVLRNLKLTDPRNFSPLQIVSLLRTAATSRSDAESVLSEDQRTRWHELLKE